MWKAIEDMDRAELLEALGELQPGVDRSYILTESLRLKLSELRSASKVSIGATVELTPLGFRIRHGKRGDFGGGVWAARWKAEKACEYVDRNEAIPPEFHSDRYMYGQGAAVEVVA